MQWGVAGNLPQTLFECVGDKLQGGEGGGKFKWECFKDEHGCKWEDGEEWSFVMNACQ